MTGKEDAVDARQDKLEAKQKRQVSLAYIFTINAISLLLLTLMGIAYTTWVNYKNNQQWCELIVFYDDVYQANPPKPESPTYEIQKKNANLMHKQRINLGCKSKIK